VSIKREKVKAEKIHVFRRLVFIYFVCAESAAQGGGGGG
jgi:hypothetical protein